MFYRNSKPVASPKENAWRVDSLPGKYPLQRLFRVDRVFSLTIDRDARGSFISPFIPHRSRRSETPTISRPLSNFRIIFPAVVAARRQQRSISIVYYVDQRLSSAWRNIDPISIILTRQFHRSLTALYFTDLQILRKVHFPQSQISHHTTRLFRFFFFFSRIYYKVLCESVAHLSCGRLHIVLLIILCIKLAGYSRTLRYSRSILPCIF